MKKVLFASLSLVALSACSTVKSPDLCSMIGWCHAGPDVEYIDVQTEEKINYVDSSYQNQRYQLPKRGERYEAANYVISPEVYSILASRVAGRVLEDAPAIFANNPKAPVYIADAVQIDRYLPDGPDAAGRTAKEILTKANMFNLVDDPNAATYVFESSVSNSNTPEVPVISYEMRLVDRNGNMYNSWSDTVRQVQNDDGSWW